MRAVTSSSTPCEAASAPLRSVVTRHRCFQAGVQPIARKQHLVAAQHVHAKRVVLTRSASEEAAQEVESSTPAAAQPAAPRDDDVLPDSLTDALYQAGESTWAAMQAGAQRCVVEILLAEFWDPMSGAVFAEEGDQMRWWKLCRRFIDDLQEQSGGKRVKVIFPDIGVAAMLKNQWPDASFTFASLNDRRPVSEEDEVVVMAAPDPPGLDDVIRIADEQLRDHQTLVLFNPRLASGDVGVGLNVRRMRDRFLSTFANSYSLRPIGDEGTVFRRYPDMWKVFVSDPGSPGRYVLAAERPSRPAGDALDLILMEAFGENEEEQQGAGGVLQGLGRTVVSLQRFMRSLSS